MTERLNGVVTALPFTVTVPIPGTDRTYSLRAPTFGEVGKMAAAQAGAPVPNDAVFLDALRDALKAATMDDAARAAHLAAIDAAEEAGDVLDSLYAVHGPDRSAWDADAKREVAGADRVARAAQRARARAEWAVRDSVALADLRRHQTEAGRREQVEVVMLCVCGDDAPRTVEAVNALPAGDVLVLYQRATALMRPGRAEEKN